MFAPIRTNSNLPIAEAPQAILDNDQGLRGLCVLQKGAYFEHPMNATTTVDDVLATGALTARPGRPANFRSENLLLQMMAAHLGRPEKLLQSLVASAKSFCRAGSAGLSLLEQDGGGKLVFRWVAMAGTYRKFVGGTTPRDFSPCGTCLDRGEAQLYRAPARYFTYLGSVEPPIYEGLVIPIEIENEQLGTIWIVSHDKKRAFDSEDARIMTSIATFLGTVLRQKKLHREREAALKEAQRSEEFSQKVLNTSPDCIKVLDHAGRVIFINQPGMFALKVKSSDVINKRWLPFWKGKDRVLAQGAFCAAKEGKDGRFQGYRPTFTGEPRWWDVTVTPLSKDNSNNPTYLCISRDVTERVRSGQQLAEANEKLTVHACSLDVRVQERTSELQCANERMQSLARKLVRSQDDERRCIARELHDEIGQQLTGLNLLLEGKEHQSNGNARATFDKAASIARKLQKQVQTLSFALRQSLPDHIKLETALRWHFKQLEQTAKLKVRFHCDQLDEERLGPEVRHTIFRIAQEALTNVVRHSKANQAQVTLSQNIDSLVLEILDNGIGFGARPARGLSSLGLSGMEERVVLLGGKFSASSRRKAGTRVSANIPIVGACCNE